MWTVWCLVATGLPVITLLSFCTSFEVRRWVGWDNTVKIVRSCLHLKLSWKKQLCLMINPTLFPKNKNLKFIWRSCLSVCQAVWIFSLNFTFKIQCERFSLREGEQWKVSSISDQSFRHFAWRRNPCLCSYGVSVHIIYKYLIKRVSDKICIGNWRTNITSSTLFRNN
jgi:hypothetical protein